MEKQIYDPIHGYITLTPLQIKIIDTEEFQRLRDLKQLGAAFYVYPSATHTRFEHSLGVCHLAGETMRALACNQPELKITKRDIEITEIAGLVHDLGHGPFSHLYDNYIKLETEEEHEERGCEIFKKMVKKYSLPLTPHEVNRIRKMIKPKPSDNWCYQIVANALNQIDVDKIDYIRRDCYHIGFPCGGEFSRIIMQCRVIDNILCYPNKAQYDIISLFMTRYRLHKRVYNHHVVKGYEFIIIKILKKLKEMNPSFMDLTDSVVLCKLHTQFKEEQKKLWNRGHWRVVTPQHINSEIQISENKKLFVEKYKIGFVSGDKTNPLDNVWLYSLKSLTKKYKLSQDDNILPKDFQETGTRIFEEN
ncbi:MAG: hypothetical protein CMF69_11465 [Magnetovibrio sp.]|nr:hypothetical protein [Magnetovibrio sp.]|tara:strand:- start:565 stop:1650 length:1086 start_codon:yes stop_codon:yes gene_type:complete